MLKPMFMLRLKSKPQFLENLDNLVFRLSKLYDRIRSRDPSAAKSPASEATSLQQPEAQVFVRTTSKYWVHADNVTEVKCFILKYLPVLIFPSRKRTIDQAVSSVYFDNKALELYNGRLEKLEGAMAIRIRWYGSDEPHEVFIERKVHREDWTGEVSVKARFPLKEKYVNDYLSGTFTVEDVKRKLCKNKRYTEEDVERLGDLAREIQDAVITKELRPVLRTFYNRTAFQLPGDARVRISLDTELSMIREDGPKRSGSNWKRNDIETYDYPFSNIGPSETECFPHAILEVKLQTHAGQEPPKWSERLTTGHLVEEVPKFSKYIHGCASLFPTDVAKVPFWIPQMDTDIRKSGPSELEESGYGMMGEGSSEDGKENVESRSRSLGSPAAHVAISIGEEEDDIGSLPSDAGERPARVFSRRDYEEDSEEDEGAPLIGKAAAPRSGRDQLGGLSFGGFLSKGSEKIDSRAKGAGGGASRAVETPRAVQEGGGAQGKKIHIPVRVEPKVFFANERTFLSWIHFSIFLGGIAAALVGLGNDTARISGFLFCIISVIFTGYALYLYRWRAARIRARDPGPYDDQVGPVLVVIVFIVAIVANLIFSIVSTYF